ncbi:MAG: hypothetical protein K2I43_07480 [Alistipes sp.]|nr:hypothetical protein [Alistipes sp.]MDE6857692.1 hypothetical protein [Alistipes sp.]
MALKDYILSEGRCDAPSIEEIDSLLKRHEWYSAARIARARLTGECDPRLTAVAASRCATSLDRPEIDIARLTEITADDIIDRFLRQDDYRIVADEESGTEDIKTEADLSDEEDVVSEQLAEIYLAQGLRDEAIAIYRKLSLLNPEKSVYFAELMAKIENNN